MSTRYFVVVSPLLFETGTLQPTSLISRTILTISFPSNFRSKASHPLQSRSSSFRVKL